MANDRHVIVTVTTPEGESPDRFIQLIQDHLDNESDWTHTIQERTHPCTPFVQVRSGENGWKGTSNRALVQTVRVAVQNAMSQL